LETFDVLQVEKEGRADLTDDLTLMYRPDALLRDKASGDLFVCSWKTTSYYGKRNLAQARVDMQSMSEVWGLEQNGSGRIEGVVYLFVVKGARKLDSWDNTYKQQSPLAYGWKRVGKNDDGIAEWSHCYSYEKEDGSGNTNLGRGWKRLPVWREYEGGVKQWIADLASQSVFPRHINALDAIFPESLPVERRRDEVEHWRNQVVAQELRVADNVTLINNRPDFVAENLDTYFPQYSHSCEAFSGCQFREICWGGVPAEPGELYQIRQSNHPEGKGDDDGQ